MRAAVLYGFAELRIEDVPDPDPGPGEVVIDVACVQPSVTECMLIAGDDIAMHAIVARQLATGPIRIGGHEFAGVVSAVGAGVTDLPIGSAVTAVETVTCGECAACRRDRPDACTRAQYIGFTRPGAFADKLVVPRKSVVGVPSGLSASAVAAIQPLAGAVHGHALAQVRPGESVLILGAGVMGLLHLQVARHGGAGLVAITGRSAAKLDLARRFGARMAWDAGDDIVAAAKEATEGVGFDVVFETAGGSTAAGLSGTSTLDLAARAVRRGGRIVMVSVLDKNVMAPLGRLREKAVTLLHPLSGAGGYSPTATAFEYSLALVARGDVDVESLVTHRLTGIEELPKALEITRDKRTYRALSPAQVSAVGDSAWPS
jgi:threonine dehydrogenase-like Zn-dependent dehydrogenase